MRKPLLLALGILTAVLTLQQPIIINAKPLQPDVNKCYDIQVYEEKCTSEYTALIDRIWNTKDFALWYDEYLTLIKKYSDIFDSPESVYDVFTEEEISYLLRMCETECHGQNLESKVHVLEVALNRIQHSDFPDDPITVITTPNQFCYCRTISQVTDETRLALEIAFVAPDLTQGALYFHSIKERDDFFGKKYIFTDDAGHKFYL